MGRKLDKFRLLMWKNFLLQWRHPKRTLVEILAPVLFCSFLVFIRSLVHPAPHPARFYEPFENKIPVMANLTTLRTIVWSPYSPVLEKIMKDVTARISRDENTVVEQRAFENTDMLETYLSNELNLLLALAGVQFDESLTNATTLPSKLNVTIRFPGELRAGAGAGLQGMMHYTWKTYLLFPVYQVGGPRGWNMNEGAEPSYYYEGFLKLQQELSYALIDHFKQTTQDQNFNSSDARVLMQRFPYPRWIEDDLLTAMQTFVSLIIMLSFVYTCINTVKVITTEKERQLKEAMKTMGLPNWLHWTAWFAKTFVLLLITVLLIVLLIKAKWYPGTNVTIFTESNPFVIFLFMIFYVCATITFCFAISVFFSKATTASVIAGIVWFVSYSPYSFMQKNYDKLSLNQKLFASLSSNTAMAYGFQLMLMFEGIGEGLQWHNIWKTTTPDDNLALGYLMLMLTLDCIIYLLVALYVEQVFPGEYGVPQPWYFPFTLSFWCNQPRFIGVEDCNGKMPDNEFLEKEPTHLQPGISITHLRKEYSNKKIAVHDLSLNMYKDHITVLLGHNGAGKTTTISMLSGMFPPSSGTAIVGGYDIRTDIAGVRESLGFCPQHNILFDELTVKEHLHFYSALKGLPRHQIDGEINKYIQLLELVPKVNDMSSNLSGGMKRKLSVGVALCGDSRVVIFDEPTSGMDPAARRALWDLLQNQKKGRTILLTTHFMDEADLLGDRIAIMAGGRLQCCGSSFFLKKKYGAGYHLIMDVSPECEVPKVTDLLQKHIPNLQVKSNIGSELSYVLSEDYSSVFEEMLNDLENNSGQLGVLSYGISLTTLEEVFMKVGADHEHDEVDNDHTTENNLPKPSSPDTKLNINLDKLEGWPRWRNQFIAMLMKRTLTTCRSWLLLAIQNFIPILFLTLAIVLVRKMQSYNDLPSLKIGLQFYDEPVTVLTYNESNKYYQRYLDFLNQQGENYINWGNESLSDNIFEETTRSTTAVRLKYIVGATFNEGNSVTAWFNNEPYHSPPLTLQLAMNAILKEEVTADHDIQFFNFPLPFTIKTKFTRLALGQIMGFQIAYNIGFSMALVSPFYIMFYIRERASKAKHLQFVSGVGVLAFWGASFVCDLITFIFTSLCTICIILVFQEDGFTKPDELGRVFSLLMCFAFSMLPLMYLASYLFSIPSTGYTRMTMINMFTGIAGFLTVQVLNSPELELEDVGEILHWIFLLIPLYSLTVGISDMNKIYETHRLCNTVLDSCIHYDLPNFPKLTPQQCQTQICKAQPRCCSTTEYYYDWKAPGAGRNVVFSISVGIFLITILLLVEYNVFEELLNKLRESIAPTPSPNTQGEEDSDVRQERNKIQNMTPEKRKAYTVLLQNVAKYYKKFLAVNNLCLGVKNSECFGLLGVNGAGKTTTFKMLTGDLKLSSGDAWVNGQSIKTDLKKIYQEIGYCPQFDALLNDLTCRETIIVFGLLRGLTMSDCQALAENLARRFNFQSHLDKLVKNLSGGNKRKLSTAVALTGDPLVIYLDEPTTGMDPATKRYFWDALCNVRDSGKCIILTSHSMEECEALCTRLAIMVNGTFMCLGSTQHLKSKFSDGYTLMIKVRKLGEGGEPRSTETQPIERFVREHFPNAILRERYEELMTFYITDTTLPWSRMFGIMEHGKKALNIEDYSLGQCSLEQVFLSFTKYQRDE